MKKIIVIIILIVISSCNTNSLVKKNEKLKIENDSLKKLLSEVNGKYVFDSISFRDIYYPNNTYKKNSEFGVELLVVGYNSNNSFFIKYDSIDLQGNLINPDTLKQKNGGFKLETKLENQKTPIKVKMEIQNKFGKSKHGTLFDIIEIKDKIGSESN